MSEVMQLLSEIVKQFFLHSCENSVKAKIVVTDLEWERTHFQHTFTNAL